MLDVHPPHHAANTWRDFFVHIATIVVGLLIAIGLEQTVEYIHHRQVITETREHIRAEVEVNERVYRSDETQITALLARMDHNLGALHALGAPHADASAKLDFSWDLQNFFDAAYTGAKQEGTLSRLPYDESATYEDAYTGVTLNTEAMIDLIKQIYEAKALLHGRRLSDLSPTEVTALETSISGVIGKAEYYKLVLDLEQQEWQAILSGNFRNDIKGVGN